MKTQGFVISLIGTGVAIGVGVAIGMATGTSVAGPTLGTPVDHYKCYKASGTTLKVPVSLQDQFVNTPSTVIKPLRFCNPVSKDGSPITVEDPLSHLLCYKISDEEGTPTKRVDTENQFGTDNLKVTSAFLLCVPTTKVNVTIP